MTSDPLIIDDARDYLPLFQIVVLGNLILRCSRAEYTVLLGNLILTPDRPEFTAFGVFEGEPLDFTRPASSAYNVSFRDANRLHGRGLSDGQSGRARAQADTDGIAPKIPLCGAALVTMMEFAASSLFGVGKDGHTQ